jgi:hypothetical protein
MKKNIQLILAIIILTVSISLLVWGYTPNPRETQVRPISSGEMQLP